MTTRPKPVCLVILDGFGKGRGDAHDAVHLARTPCLDQLFRDYPYGWINASEGHVGLPGGQMGNSEVGHMNIGAGRVVMQDLPRIDAAIDNGELAENPAFTQWINTMKKSGGTAHLLGLISPGGVHAHQRHVAELARLVASRGVPVAIHAWLDGRDTPPKSAVEYMQQLLHEVAGHANIQLATIGGRYFSMDRDKRWPRVQKAYDAMVNAAPLVVDDALQYIRDSYAQGVSDEFIVPAALRGYQGMQDGDGIVMANFRADRARQILTALLSPESAPCGDLVRSRKPAFAAALGMVEYSTEINSWMPALFPPESLSDLLGEVVASAGLTQLRIAETEKYAHVTFFFNGGREEVFPGEERILVPSPQVATYDLQPEMSAAEVTNELVKAIESNRFDLVVVNYANTDMVGHTGDMGAAIKAVETVDQCLQRLCDAALPGGGALLITADHGNCEQMHDPETMQAHTAHTLNLVPSILVSKQWEGKTQSCEQPGKLADIAPTLLDMLQLPKPAAMTGSSLLATVK